MENIQEITQEEGADIREKTNPAAIVVSLLSVIPAVLADMGEAANNLLWYYQEKTYSYDTTASFFEAHPYLDSIESNAFFITFLGYFILPICLAVLAVCFIVLLCRRLMKKDRYFLRSGLYMGTAFLIILISYRFIYDFVVAHF